MHLLQYSTASAAAASFDHKTISFSSFVYERDHGNFTFAGENTTIDGGALQLTPDTAHMRFIDHYYNKSGRIMYRHPFRLFSDDDGNRNNTYLVSFNSTFVINLYKSPAWDISGHGLAFVIAPNDSFPPESSYGQWLGLTNAFTDGNKANHFVAIEFDTVKQGFDPDDNHLGLNINSVVSRKNVPLKDNYNITLSDGTSYTVWVQYDGKSKLMQVFMDREGETMPQKPLLKETINLKDYLKPESYFGFSASTGYPHIQLNCVRSWTLDIDVIQTKKEKDRKWLVISAGVGVPLVAVLLVLCAIAYVKKRRSRVAEPHHNLGKLRLPGMPREFKYKELKKATNNFHESMRLGEGGFGIVYKGIIHHNDQYHVDNTQIAVKKFSRDSIKSKGDFLAELAIIHRLRHKHLVHLVGWCHEKGELLLVYDFMPNGSLEKYLYGTSEQVTLNWNHRYKILTGVASAVYYLQNEYDQKVVHRDLKASNILLDADFNARLGDFGLARAIENERNSYAEHGLVGVPGTMGYVAPECFHTGKATPESDVFGFGAVVLEVVSGRSPGNMIPHQQHAYTLVDWVWMLHREGHIQDAVDQRLNINSVVDEAKRLLLLGLACSHPIASERPKTEDILQIISGTSTVPYVPQFKPAFTWPSTSPPISMFDSILSSITLSSPGSG
ncbi:hypothetical protein WN943_023936 [Citrus x changshan-huyou]